MSLTLLTGPARSGKSDLAVRLAIAAGAPVVVAAAGRASDPEMARRIERHRAQRPEAWTTLELTPAMLAVEGPAAWLAEVPAGAALVVDCLGTLVGALLESLLPAEMADEALAEPGLEDRLEAAVALVLEALADRGPETIVVSNETGWGVVPSHASARVHRDVLGRATRTLADRADRAWLVVAGRGIDLTARPRVEEI